ncbi:sigma factor-like helix-turn-helix DNA-binding protein [Kitasatospora sp. NPDC002227]|uniref:sigma factor-like helix-turn-helix DNA-binding protein n=1 Tax=Kitasatospora sp. NPDC002227 TaxID=3154773 RepID=UPI00333103F2
MTTLVRPHRPSGARLLTPREAQALALLAAGHPTPVIAHALGLPPDTTRVLLHRALRKLGVRTRAEVATALAVPTAAAPAPAVEAPFEVSFEVSFGGLVEAAHARLVQQTFLLTGRRHRAKHCVRLALAEAGHRWRSVTGDPEAWVRAHAFERALSPWRRGGPRRAHRLRLPRRRIHVHPEQAQPARDRALLRALRRLPRPQRRALVLHDGLGLPAAVVATEVESSTPAAEGRIRAGRAALAAAVPDLVGPDPLAPGFGERLSALLHGAAVRGCPAPRRPAALRLRLLGHLRAGLPTAAAGLLTLAVGTAMIATLTGNGPSAHLHHPPAASAPSAEPPPDAPARPTDFLKHPEPHATVSCGPLRICGQHPGARGSAH